MFVRSNSVRGRTRSSSMGSTDYQQVAAQEEQITVSNGPIARTASNSRGIFSSLSDETFGEVLIFASQFMFGLTFSCQRVAMVDGMKPLTFNAWRYVISVIVLVIYLWITKTPMVEPTPEEFQAMVTLSQGELQANKAKKERETWYQLFYWGSILGVMSIGGSMLQQIGLVTVTAGKTGFITGMYVIFVPIVEYLFPCFHTTLSMTSVIATFVSFIGVYLLSGCAEQETCFGGAIKEGEVIVFISMFFWVGSIVFADISSKQLDGVWLTLVEFTVTMIVTIIVAYIVEPDEWVYPFVSAQQNWKMIIIVGICEATAFALSTVGQTYSSPTRAALIYSLEAVVCATFAYFFLGETLTWVECFGGLLMFLACVCSSTAVAADEESQSSSESDSGRDGDESSKPIMVQHSGFGSLEMTTRQNNSV